MKKQCPDDEMYGDYLQGRLSNGQRSRIEAHLASCDNCLEDLAVVTSLVRGASPSTRPVPPEVTRKAIALVAGRPSPVAAVSLVWQTVKGACLRVAEAVLPLTPEERMLAPIRGSKQRLSPGLVCVRKTFSRIDTEIEIEKKKTAALIRVRLKNEPSGHGAVRVTLERGEREVSSLLCAQGGATFDDVEFGHYSLIFAVNGTKLGKYTFEIKESGRDR